MYPVVAGPRFYVRENPACWGPPGPPASEIRAPPAEEQQ